MSHGLLLVTGRHPWARFGGVVIVILVGLLLRSIRLDFQSLWLDEAASAYLAHLPYKDIIAASFATEPNPPLYFLLLRGWGQVFGFSEVGLRSLSVVGGALYLPFIYLMGRELFQHRVGLAAALLAAANPFLIWYSQEARAFAWFGATTLAGTYLFVRASANNRALWWVGFFLATLAGLYLHAYAVFLIPFYVVSYGLLGKRRREEWAAFLAALGGALALFAPWAITMAAGAVGSNWRLPYPFLELAETTFQAFLTGEAVSREAGRPWLALGGLLFLASLWPLRKGGQERNLLFLGFYLAIPLALSYLFSLYTPIYSPRYMMVALAPFLLLLARGVEGLRNVFRPLGMASLVALLFFFGQTLLVAYTIPLKENYRSAARYLQYFAAPDDQFIFVAGVIKLGFQYYGVEGYAPFQQVQNSQQVAESLSPLAEKSGRLWLVLSHQQFSDPRNLVQEWLSQRYPLATEQYPRGIHIHSYTTRYRLAALPLSATPIQALFQGGASLIGYEIANPRLPPTDSQYHPPSNWLHLQLYWQAKEPLWQDYEVMVRLVDKDYQVWGDKLSRSGEAFRIYPPQRWQKGEIIRAEYDVNLNPVTPPGRYRVEVSLVSQGSRVPVTDGERTADRFLFGEVEIIPWDQ
ncbi:MAG: glycosyltransferase family 39 protein [Chloroflexi bacterium]|nr:glycosyltransferase family 39 protein [Chloroflexota bacterium]